MKDVVSRPDLELTRRGHYLIRHFDTLQRRARFPWKTVHLGNLALSDKLRL